MSHMLHNLQFASLTSEAWDSLPDFETIKLQIATAALAHSEVSGERYGLYTPPDEIREVRLTEAAASQVRSMWHGHRDSRRSAPPIIPLKIFVFAYGQRDKHTWAKIEVHPGLDNWESSK